MSKKAQIKLNKNHNGKEFFNKFHFVGQVSPVQKKDEGSDNWFDVELFDTTKTRTGKDRRVTQFNLETAPFNRLKVEVAGMEQDFAFLWSSTEKKSHRIAFADRHNKELYPNETYHLIDTDWDKAEKVGNVLQNGIWVDVKGHYEFDTFIAEDGKEIKLVKRIIDSAMPLRNGEVTIKGLKAGDTFRAYDAKEDGVFLGQGKANAEGVATIRVGWLNPEGGKLYICKVEEGNKEGQRSEQAYTEATVENDRITITNNLPTSSVRIDKPSGGYEYVEYVRDFKDDNFFEINSFEMQLGIKSTYQDDETKHTKVNGVFLDYGKDRSTPKDVDLMVYYKEAEEGKTAIATAFGRLNPLDFLVVEGVDNHRAETAKIEVEEKEEDNPFEDVGEKVVSYETVTTGTRKGLEILNYITGTYSKELLTEEEISPQSMVSEDPFASVEVSSDDLPF
ncbi:hypothetical protein ABE073_04815 [Lederbergia citrisecunda]|uniref:hypothetical protein n=1 Tax=Lederbergia citrisecunda TaxID=2833583 RepID=UPI003D2CC295